MIVDYETVLVFGGSGGLGRHVVAELLQRGACVRALVHRRNPFDQHARLAFVGVDAVIATLGGAEAPIKDVSSAAMLHLIPAMLFRVIRRIVSVTGSAVRDGMEVGSEHPYLLARREWMMRHNPALVLDGERHLLLLRNSELDWTVVRTPRMVDGTASNCRLVAEPPPPSSVVSYRAVAATIVDQLDARNWLRRAPFASP